MTGIKHSASQSIIDNFIRDIDTRLPTQCHVQNALNEAKIYKWNDETLKQLIETLENLDTISYRWDYRSLKQHIDTLKKINIGK